jgi:N-acyl homoserine lactone hydrolase
MPPTITPLLVAELLVEGERWPVYVHAIDHPEARVLVDTGMTELRPEVADMDPRLMPLTEQEFDLATIDIVVNTHLHFDHCGGNHLFAGCPIYVQRRELEDARTVDYTISEWVDAPGVTYEEVPVVRGGDPAVRHVELDEPRTEGQLLVRALEPALVWLAHEHEPWSPGSNLRKS